MKRDAVIDRGVQVVRLIVSHSDIAWTPQRREHRLHEAAIDVAGECNLPWPDLSGETWRHGVDGDHDGIAVVPDDRLHRRMIRLKPLFDARPPRRWAQVQVALDRSAVAHLRDKIVCVELAITVDDQPGGAA